MTNLRQYEQDETLALRGLVERMNHLHSVMGGRDNRPERVALLKCIRILNKEIERSVVEWVSAQSPPSSNNA